MRTRFLLPLLAALTLLLTSPAHAFEVESGTPVPGAIRLQSHWHFEVERSGTVIDSWEQTNLVTTEGLAAMMGNMFGDWGGVTPWFVMLYDNSITPVIGDSYTSNNMSECTAYTVMDSAKSRATWYGEPGTGTTVWTNSADRAEFDIVLASGSTTIYGAALVSSGVSGDATSGNTLFSLTNFSAGRELINGDSLKLTIQYTLAP